MTESRSLVVWGGGGEKDRLQGPGGTFGDGGVHYLDYSDALTDVYLMSKLIKLDTLNMCSLFFVK